MLEIFAGMAVLCATSKSAGLANSIAVDKIRKRSCRSSIFQLDLLKQRDREILEQWMVSPLLLWIHLAPVCGTASRARDIRRFANDPKPCVQMNVQRDALTFLKLTSAELVSQTTFFNMHAFSFCWPPKWEFWRPWKIRGTVISGLHVGSYS